MTKKNIKPQQSAPVQREINATSTVGNDGGITPTWRGNFLAPFAGDNAE